MVVVKFDELVIIIYISGIIGNLKGVMLMYDNIVSNVMGVKKYLFIGMGEIVLSFLLFCYIFECIVVYFYVYNGINIVYIGIDNLGGDDGDLCVIQFYFFIIVLCFLEKVYEKIYNKGLELMGVKKFLFFWVFSFIDDYDYDK